VRNRACLTFGYLLQSIIQLLQHPREVPFISFGSFKRTQSKVKGGIKVVEFVRNCFRCDVVGCDVVGCWLLVCPAPIKGQ
jgi:hypothetical protein